jgi:hypothetical protein
MNTPIPAVEAVPPVVEKPFVEPPPAKSVTEKEINVENVTEPGAEKYGPGKPERTWSEEIELAGSQLVEQVKEWIAEGNVRRLILRTPDDSLVLEIPLMAGAVIGGVLTFFAPLLVVLGAIASVFARVRVEIVREEEATPTEAAPKEATPEEPALKA